MTSQKLLLVRCPDCGHMRVDLPEPHAPRWKDGKLVDCQLREVRR